MANPSQFQETRSPTVRPAFMGAWLGGVAAALLCGLVYFGFGTRWTFRPRPSLYVHHTLTAQAWLKGRTYVEEGEIRRQYMTNTLLRAGRPVPREWQYATQVAFEELQAEYFRSLGVPEKGITEEIQGSVRRGLLDWVRADPGLYIAYWPPVPSAIMVPLVALFGTNFSDVVVANVLGALSVLGIYFMLGALRRHWPVLTPRACLALTLFYGLGTCHMYQASTGQVWLITQLCATLFLILAIVLALFAADPRRERKNFGLWLMAAACLALGFLSRNTIILAAPIFLVLLWHASKTSGRAKPTFAATASCCGLILALAVAMQLWFNYIRFEDALDFGQGRLADAGGNDLFAAEFHEHGRFSLYFLPRNIWYYFLNPAIRQYPAYDQSQAGWTFDPMGNSLFLVSPLFLYMFIAGRGNAPRGLIIAVLAGALPGLTALMLFHGTGWYQFGQRYLLDVMPFLLLVVAFGMRGRLTRVSATLIALSMVVNAWGTYRFILEQG